MPHPAPFSTQKNEREAALAFLSVRGIGPATLVNLTDAFDSLADALLASPEDLEPYLRPDARRALAEDPSLRGRLEGTLARLAHHQASVLFRGDPGWPSALTDLGPSEPVALFVRGQLRLDQRAVAVVGSRKADDYGLSRARGMGARLADAKLITVSGGAAGIDGEAHLGALSGKGCTFAILGSGFDFPFPREHAPLFERIAAEGGALVSELPPAHEPKAGNFPRRNNLVAALGEATVVVRGDTQSGAMLTAVDAHELGRPLLAVPGRVDEPQSKGPHLLLRLGWAKPCCDFNDVLAAIGLGTPIDESALARHRPSSGQPELELAPRRPPKPALAPPTGVVGDIWAALSSVPVHFDELMASTRLSVSALSAQLTQLEVEGRVEQLPGKHFVRGDR